jgi:hypothetical protein
MTIGTKSAVFYAHFITFSVRRNFANPERVKVSVDGLYISLQNENNSNKSVSLCVAEYARLYESVQLFNIELWINSNITCAHTVVAFSIRDLPNMHHA